jgi:hypothetical protein
MPRNYRVATHFLDSRVVLSSIELDMLKMQEMHIDRLVQIS